MKTLNIAQGPQNASAIILGCMRIIDREGNVVARFEPTADMAAVEACVKSLL